MADPKNLKEAVGELAMRAAAIGLLERCRRHFRMMGPGNRPLLQDLDAFLGAPGLGGESSADPPLGSHAADLQSLRATQEALEKAEGKIKRARALLSDNMRCRAQEAEEVLRG